MSGRSRLPASLQSSQAPQLTAALVVATVILLLVHRPALNSQALCFDDDQYLTDNLLVQTPSLSSALRFLGEVLTPSTVGGYYQPLAMISLMLDYKRGGRPDNLTVFHQTNLILHAFNVIFVILILYLLFSNVWLAASVGLIFGLHPMTVETINWVGERKTLLASFFAFLSILSYVLYQQTARRTYYWLSFAVFLLALLSKPTSTLLPFALVVLDYWPFQTLTFTRIHTVISAIRTKWPFCIASIISAIITYISQANTADVTLPVEYSRLHIPLILCHNVMFYIYKLIWPIDLSSHYPTPQPFDLSNVLLIAMIVGTCGLVALLLFSLSKTRALFGGWLFFFVAIFPTFGVIGFSNTLVADKYIYFPALGLLLSLAWALNRLLTTMQAHVRPA